jgi:hypothetical protein
LFCGLWESLGRKYPCGLEDSQNIEEGAHVLSSSWFPLSTTEAFPVSHVHTQMHSK